MIQSHVTTQSGELGYGRVGSITRPYLSVKNTESGAFALDTFVLWLLDSEAMTVDTVGLFSAFCGFAKKRASFGNSPFAFRSVYDRTKIIGVVSLSTDKIFGQELGESTPVVLEANVAYPAAPPVFSLAVPQRVDIFTTARYSEVRPSNQEIPSPHITTGHGRLLADIYDSAIWSWRELSAILGPSHTDLQRIAKGRSPSPSAAQRIDSFYKFFRSLIAVTGQNKAAITRCLNTPSERDGLSASDHLSVKDFRKAFSAMMDVVSPRPTLVPGADLPLRWYREPSRALHDTDTEDNGGA